MSYANTTILTDLSSASTTSSIPTQSQTGPGTSSLQDSCTFYHFSLRKKLYLTGYIILLPLSARFAVRAVDHKNSSLAVLSFPFVFNYLLHKGFYNFSYSLPIFFLVTGYWLKKQEHFRWREGLTLTLLWLTLYFSHIFTVVTTCVAIGLLAFLFTAFDLSNHFRGQSIPFWKRLRSRALIPFIAFIPTLLFALNFMHQKGADSGTTTPMTFQLGRLLTLESLVSYHEFERWLAVTLVFLFAVLTAYALHLQGRPLAMEPVGRPPARLSPLCVHLFYRT